MEQLLRKENAIFEVLQKFLDEKLEFIVVGGYAVSAYKHRFSVDADIVIQSKDLEKFESILKKDQFEKTREKKLENIYSSSFIRYEKDTASFDILIEALAARTTGATFSYGLLHQHSATKKIIGIEKEVEAKIPMKEMIIVMKIHSGRLTDFRDIVALAKSTDLEMIRKLLFIGDVNVVRHNLAKLSEISDRKGFIDSFKGVFMEKKFDADLEQVKRISKLELKT